MRAYRVACQKKIGRIIGGRIIKIFMILPSIVLPFFWPEARFVNQPDQHASMQLTVLLDALAGFISDDQCGLAVPTRRSGLMLLEPEELRGPGRIIGEFVFSANDAGHLRPICG